MTVPAGYDPVTLNHWLWYKYQCHEGSPTDFQRLFENIMKRARPEFVQIRPYGNIGDRKADGLFVSESTIFQVYSPDTLTQAEVVKKINEDLDEAVAHWGDDLKKWVFVYNVRRGIPPDIPKILKEKQKQYPQIGIDHLSSDALWEIARNLTLQQRAEVLGAPSGYESLFFVPDTRLVPTAIPEPTQDAWIVLVHDVLVPIDVRSVLEALKPATPFGAPIFIRPGTSSWEKAAEYQRSLVAETLAKSRHSFPPRFAVFSIAPIPLIIQLGFLLSDSVLVRYYKYHIDTQSWQWPDVDPQNVDLDIQVSGLPEKTIQETCDVLIRISLSAKVGRYETDEVVPGLPVQVDIFVEEPSLLWIRSPRQLDRIGSVFRRVLTEIRTKVPYCQQIHLFCAVPAPGALIIGQQINPRMNPPVQVYEYSRQSWPRYELALTLKKEEK
jgi:hypothetical protein